LAFGKLFFRSRQTQAQPVKHNQIPLYGWHLQANEEITLVSVSPLHSCERNLFSGCSFKKELSLVTVRFQAHRTALTTSSPLTSSCIFAASIKPSTRFYAIDINYRNQQEHSIGASDFSSSRTVFLNTFSSSLSDVFSAGLSLAPSRPMQNGKSTVDHPSEHHRVFIVEVISYKADLQQVIDSTSTFTDQNFLSFE